MGGVIEIAPDIQQDIQDSQRQELEMLRQLGVIQLVTIQGKNDEDCEQQWLEFFNADEDKDCVLYAAEPGLK